MSYIEKKLYFMIVAVIVIILVIILIMWGVNKASRSSESLLNFNSDGNFQNSGIGMTENAITNEITDMDQKDSSNNEDDLKDDDKDNTSKTSNNKTLKLLLI